MHRAPVPFCGCGGTPHGRGSFAERTVFGGRLSGRGKGLAKQAGVVTGGPLFTICRKRGVGTWWRRKPSGTVSVRSVPGGCRRGARLVLTFVPDLDALPVRGERERGGRKAGWPGFPHSGKERAGTEGESGKAGVPLQWERTGQDKGRKWDGRGSLVMGGNGPGRKRRKRDGRVPSQWEGTGQQEKEKAGWPGFPRNGKEGARRGESGMSARSEAESESEVGLGAGLEAE
jgi:hypothetical protein